jgi:peptidyl-prolyl cis-trans isomerase A (cyclophilin A)
VFINLADNERLDGRGFTPFGRVTEGMDVVEALYGGYGDGPPGGAGPAQEMISAEGNAYLVKNFPKLDYIRKAVVVQ